MHRNTAKDSGLLDLVALIPQFSSCTVLIICFRKHKITEHRQNGDNIRDKLMHSLNIWNMYGRIRRPPLVLTKKMRNANAVYEIENKAKTKLHVKLTECITLNLPAGSVNMNGFYNYNGTSPNVNQSPHPYSYVPN